MLDQKTLIFLKLNRKKIKITNLISMLIPKFHMFLSGWNQKSKTFENSKHLRLMETHIRVTEGIWLQKVSVVATWNFCDVSSSSSSDSEASDGKPMSPEPFIAALAKLSLKDVSCPSSVRAQKNDSTGYFPSCPYLYFVPKMQMKYTQLHNSAHYARPHRPGWHDSPEGSQWQAVHQGATKHKGCCGECSGGFCTSDPLKHVRTPDSMLSTKNNSQSWMKKI